MLGYALLFRSRHMLYLVPAVTLLMVWRIGTEERMLDLEFGREWKEFCERTWRLVPYVY